MKKFVTFALALCLSTFIGIATYIYFSQESRIFKNSHTEQNEPISSKHPFDEIYLPASKNTEIHGLHFYALKPKGVIYFLHGSGQNLKKCSYRADAFVRMGYDVFMIDYRGFGKSTNILTAETLKEDAEIGYRYLQGHYKESQIITYGYSLGSAMATWLGAKYQPKALFLEAPFSSMLAMSYRHEPSVPKWAIQCILKYHLRSDLWMKDVNSPIRIMHGVLDEIVPIEEAFILVNQNKNSKNIQIKEFMSCNHNNISEDKDYENTFNNWLEEIN
jgi:uncharacterized protein